VTVDPHSAAAGGGNLFYADFGGGISGSRAPAISVPEDNVPHVVRITFPGGVKNLKNLRLDPTSGAFPKTVSFDYVRVYGYQPSSFTDVTLNASDIAGTSSLNSAGHWDSSAAPTTGSNYFTGAFQLRTPGGSGFVPFGGSALTVDAGGSLLFKGSGGAEIRKLTLAGGSLVQGATGASPDTAKIFVPDGIPVTAASSMSMTAVNRTLEITGSLSGSAALSIATGATAPAAGQAAGQVVLKSDNSGYSGALTVESNAWLDLDHDNAVAGAAMSVEAGSMVRRSGADANGTTTAASWAISGRGNLLGNGSTRGAIYFNQNGLAANLVGDIAISGTQTRIGSYSARGGLAIDGNISGTGTLEFWGGGAAETHIQKFTLNGASTTTGQTDVISDGRAQTHLVLGGDDRLPTGRKLRLNATWGSTTADGAGAFFDLHGYDQTLSNLQLDGGKRKKIYDSTASGLSTLTLSGNNGAFDTNGGSVYIEGITIQNTGNGSVSGTYIDNGSVVTLTDATWNSSFYTALGQAGNGDLVLVNSTFTFGGELLMARTDSNGTLTVDATSTVSTANFFRIGDSALGTATVNLNGGTLAAKRFFRGSTGPGVLNLNGGTLKASGDNTVDWIRGDTNPLTVNLKSAGISVDSDGFDITATAPILEDAGSTGGGLTKKGLGAFYLDGTNTYTGATAVTVGTLGGNGSVTSNVSVSTDAGLAFLVIDPGLGAGIGYSDLDITGALTVPASLVIKIDSAGVTFPETSATGLTLVTASGGISGFSSVTFDLSDFTGAGTWSAYQDGTSIKLDYTAGGASAYATWINTFTSLTDPNDKLPEANPDGDSLNNIGEFAFGGDPTKGGDQGPSASLVDGGKFINTYAVRSGTATLLATTGAPL
jgi:autotransporter-associated beta strand protein